VRLVVDSSISLKWWLDDEEFTEEARLLLKKIIDGEIELIIPELWYYEVANGITTAVRRKRITEEDGMMFVEELQSIPASLCEIIPNIKKTYQDAVKYQHAIYDMAYLTVAELENIQFITGDEKLINTVADTKLFVKHISGLKYFPYMP